jgi:long-chain fatty acid transport protein
LVLFSSFSASPDNLSDRGTAHSTGAGVRVGWLGKIGDVVTLGATWESKIRAGRFEQYSGLFANAGSFDIPESFGLGIAVRPVRALTIDIDWQRILYSQVASVGDSVNALFAGVPLGASNGPGFGWRNISVYKLGGSYAITETVTLRAGVSHADQPVPASQTFFNILAPGVVQTHLTAGVSWKVADRNEVSVAALHGFKKTVNGAVSWFS